MIFDFVAHRPCRHEFGVMHRQNTVQAVLFGIFFVIGASALSGSVLCGDLVQYYQNRRVLRSVEESLERLRALNTDYDAVLRQLERDPNLVRHIAPAILGTQPEGEDEDVVYPKATDEQLAAVRRILSREKTGQPPEPEMPRWIIRCSRMPQRVILFLAGGFLVLVSFVFFGPRPAANRGR